MQLQTKLGLVPNKGQHSQSEGKNIFKWYTHLGEKHVRWYEIIRQHNSNVEMQDTQELFRKEL